MSKDFHKANIAGFVATYEETYGIPFIRRIKQLMASYPGDQSSLCWEGQDIGTPRSVWVAIKKASPVHNLPGAET